MSRAPDQDADLQPLRFDDLPRWHDDDHAAAFAAFVRSARRMVDEQPADGLLGVRASDLQRVAWRALALPRDMTPAAARSFFEAHFEPVAVRPTGAMPFLTGYFEPEVEGSLVPTEQYRYPLYSRPDDLIDVTADHVPLGRDRSNTFARSTLSGLAPYFDRAEIDAGALQGRNLELVYLADPVDVFFIHVQGSARIRLPDGSHLRVAYAAKSGHPYTSIGKRLIERGLASPATMTLDWLRDWLTRHRQAGAALMRENRSYIFFQILDPAGLDSDLGAIAAAGVQITPGRSLAVDRTLHTYGTPIWLDAVLPFGVDGTPRHIGRLMIAQDTGSAIVGAARGDMFIGSGPEAGRIAGRIRHEPSAFVIFRPK